MHGVLFKSLRVRRIYNYCLLSGQLNSIRRSSFRRTVEPAEVTPSLTVPSHITVPDYSSLKSRRKIDIKTADDIKLMRECCQLARKALNFASELVKVGVTTDDIDRLTHDKIISDNAYPSPLHYRGFPKSICTSVNNVAIHGIPDNRPLEDGDIINIDVTVFYNGFHGDCSATYEVGCVDEAGRALIEAARTCRDKAIQVCAPGKPFGLIGKTISACAKSLGFKIVPEICGHGIGTYFHGPPDIIHCENNFPGVMKEGMTFTIEPLVSENCEKVLVMKDGWTTVTANGCRAAQFEHTVVITDRGVEILTK